MRYQRVQIEAFAWELASDVVTTDELEDRLSPVYKALHIQPGQLEAMTGIVERRYWAPGYAVSRGAAAAALNLLRDTGFDAGAIEALIYGGVCRDGFEPATACHVAGHLEDLGHTISPGAFVYDVGNACLGVLNGMVELANRIELGQIRAGLVVSAESAREIVDAMIDQMNAHPTMDLFKTAVATMTGGSGAVAVLLTDGSFGGPSRRRLRGGAVQTAPRFHDLCVWGVERLPGQKTAEGDPSYRQTMATHSVDVLNNGVVLGRQTWETFLGRMGWSADAVDKVVSHQVGSSHRRAYLEALEIADHKDFIAYAYLGNTGTVALPLAAALAEQRGFIRAGDRVALLGIGSGLNCMMLGVDW